MFTTFTGKIPILCHRYIYPKNLFPRFSTHSVYQTEHDAHQLVDFDSNAFDVLFDNYANRTVSPVKSDFLNLGKYDGELKGVGSPPIKGTGTIHWQTVADDGSKVDIYVKNALYVPKIQHMILSVTQLGNQRTQQRIDALQDLTRITTDPDQSTSTLYTDRRRQVTTIIHTNNLSKTCCTNFNVTSFPVFSRCFNTYSNICLPCIEHVQANMQWIQRQCNRNPNYGLNIQAHQIVCDWMRSDKQANPKTGSETKDTPTLPPILRPSKYKKKVSFNTWTNQAKTLTYVRILCQKTRPNKTS